MKNKIVMIAAFLAVMVSMTGTAMAYVGISPNNIVVDINTDAPVAITTDWYSGSLVLSTMQITIYKDNNGNGQVDGVDAITDDLEVQLDAEGYTSSFPAIYNPMIWDSSIIGAPNPYPPFGVTNIYSETLSVRDANNGATTTDKYVIAFDAGNGIMAIWPISTSTPVSTIPEFPTIALPIAAVLGLVFFFHSRKNKEE